MRTPPVDRRRCFHRGAWPGSFHLPGCFLVHFSCIRGPGVKCGRNSGTVAAGLGSVQGDLVENGRGGVGGRGIEELQAFLSLLTEQFPLSVFPSKYRSTALFYNSVPSSGRLKWILL